MSALISLPLLTSKTDLGCKSISSEKIESDKKDSNKKRNIKSPQPSLYLKGLT
jgi:hypothetical protein